MKLAEFIRWIRQELQSCITTSVRENQCSLRLANLRADSMAILNGSAFQRYLGTNRKLADRIIFSESQGGFLCVAELKAGSWKARETVEQVQNGFAEAHALLQENGVDMRSWFALVLSPRGPGQEEKQYLRKNLIAFQGDRQPLRHARCDIELSELMRR